MKDPKRIPKVLNEIKKIWKESPDLRLCQLIGNCFTKDQDIYYVDDDELIRTLKNIYVNAKA